MDRWPAMILDRLHALIGPDGEVLSVTQMCTRAIIVLLVGLIIVRLAGKRMFGKWGAIDIVISVVIGSNLSRALTGNSPFVATIAATALLVLLHKLLTRVAAFWPAVGPLLKGTPRQLVAQGVLDRQALRRSGLGEQDLQEALRARGIGLVEEAEEVWLERDGSISVIKRS